MHFAILEVSYSHLPPSWRSALPIFLRRHVSGIEHRHSPAETMARYQKPATPGSLAEEENILQCARKRGEYVAVLGNGGKWQLSLSCVLSVKIFAWATCGLEIFPVLPVASSVDRYYGGARCNVNSKAVTQPRSPLAECSVSKV